MPGLGLAPLLRVRYADMYLLFLHCHAAQIVNENLMVFRCGHP